MGDSGLTGRKVIVDTYGGAARHGGGAFSGKDPSKVDRSAAYAARYVAKNVVAAGLADRCEVQVAYAIGVAHPVSLMIETFGTGKVSAADLSRIVREEFDLRPGAIVRDLDLRRPIFQKTAAYGHFGRYGSRLHVGAHRPGRRAEDGRRACLDGGRRHGGRLLVRPGADRYWMPGPGWVAVGSSPTPVGAVDVGRAVDPLDHLVGVRHSRRR